MKIESKKDASVIGALLAGSALILISIIKCIYDTNIVYSIITSGAIWFGLILFGYAWYAANKPETEILPDERTERNSQKAGYATFWIILASVGLILLADGGCVATLNCGCALYNPPYRTRFVFYTWMVLQHDRG